MVVELEYVGRSLMKIPLLLCVCLQVDKLLYERNVAVGAREMALELRVLTALTEDPDSAPRTHMAARNLL